MNITIYEAAKWVMEHRSGFAFKDYDIFKVCEEIKQSIEIGVLYYAQDNDTLIGIVCCDIDTPNKKVFVRNMLTTRPLIMSLFVNMFLQDHKGWEVLAYRKGKFLRTIQPKVVNRIYDMKVKQ